MDTTQSRARRAGLLYGLAGALAPFAFLYVPGVLLAGGDALATADRVRASEILLRAAVGAELSGAILLVFAALALHRLLKEADQGTANLMAALMLVSVPVSFVNALIHAAPLVLLKSPTLAGALVPDPVAAQVTFFLRLHNLGLVVNQILWGLWLFPTGALVLRSGFFPRWLAYPLFLAGAGYVVHSLGSLLLPPSLQGITRFGQILGVGELPFFGFYLLIWGVRGKPVDRLAAGLVLLSFALGTGAFVLLNLRQIDAIPYAALEATSLVVLLGLVHRWRWLEASERRSTA